MTNERFELASSVSNEQVAESVISDEGTSLNGASRDDRIANDHTVYDDTMSDDTVSDEIQGDDLFRYGWRYVQRVAADGIVQYDQIPLTLEDLLHPEEEDFRMQNPMHNQICIYLKMVLSRQLTDISDALILQDTRVDWSIPSIKPFGPDITVIMEANMQPPDKGTFVTGEDGIAPIMVIEVTSPTTRNQDFHDKPQLMQQAGLPYYFMADIVRDPEKRKLYGYEAYV